MPLGVIHVDEVRRDTQGGDSMDGVLAGVLTEVIAVGVVKSVRALSSEWRSGSSDFGSSQATTEVKSPDGETVGFLSDDQVQELRNFLQQPAVRSLVQACVLLEFARKSSLTSDEVHASNVQLQDRFTKAADQAEVSWSSLAPELWESVTASAKSVVSAPEGQYLTATEINGLLSSTGGVGTSVSANQSLPRFVRKVLEATSDDEHLRRMSNARTDIRVAMKQWAGKARLQQLRTHFEIKFGDIYIDRTLISRTISGTSIASNAITSPDRRVCAVILGNPGAGKSTLTQHVIHECTSTDHAVHRLPLLVMCRDAIRRVTDETFEEIIAHQLRVDISGTDADAETITWLLSLGQCLVIFDGIDEILDVSLRRDFIRKVEAFAENYPACSVLATSRLVGYETAKFSTDGFDELELREFNKDQVREYVERWFSQDDEDIERGKSFLAEGESLEDLLSNPLMLSLLCDLYYSNGYIPQNRRGVYKECSDLLFQRWDRYRKIDPGVQHIEQVRQLMMALAYWFSTSQQAQSGVPETQLVRVLANYLRDTAGVIDEESEGRAEEFLEFCSGRAWLLTRLGTSNTGERLFGFTHRTFLEYFSAEEIVRRNPDPIRLASEIVKVYREDPASVRADLIFQCACSSLSQGAHAIIKELLAGRGVESGMSDSTYYAMLLRLVASSAVGAATQNQLFVAIGDHWVSCPAKDDWPTTNGVFTMYRDSRNRFIEGLRGGDTSGALDFGEARNKVREAFLDRWARFRLMRATMSDPEQWESVFRDLANGDSSGILSVQAAAWLFEIQGSPHPAIHFPDGLVSVGIGTTIPGTPLLSWAKVLGGSADDEWQAHLAATNSKISRWPEVNQVTAERILDLTVEMNESLRGHEPVRPTHLDVLRPLAVWLCAITSEQQKACLPVFESVLDINAFEELRRYRHKSIRADRGTTVRPPSLSATHQVLVAASPWLTKWIAGHDLIKGFGVPMPRAKRLGDGSEIRPMRPTLTDYDLPEGHTNDFA